MEKMNLLFFFKNENRLQNSIQYKFIFHTNFSSKILIKHNFKKKKKKNITLKIPKVDIYRSSYKHVAWRGPVTTTGKSGGPSTERIQGQIINIFVNQMTIVRHDHLK
jgi:hypothetical protein